MVMHPYVHSFPCTFVCDGVWPLYKTVEQVFYKTVTDVIFLDGNWALKFNISYPLKRRSSEPSHRMTHDRLIKRYKIYVTVNLVHMNDRLIRCRIWRCTPSYMTVVDRHIDFKNPTRCDVSVDKIVSTTASVLPDSDGDHFYMMCEKGIDVVQVQWDWLNCLILGRPNSSF